MITFNADTPEGVISEASQRRLQYVFIRELRSRALTSDQVVNAVHMADDWGIEVKGFLSHDEVAQLRTLGTTQ